METQMPDTAEQSPVRRSGSAPRWAVLAAMAALLFLVLAGYLFLTRDRQAARAAPPSSRDPASRVTPVTVARAKTGDVAVQVSGLGSVTPFYAVTVKTRVDGQLMRVAAAEGSQVRAGDLVAEIDPRPFDIAIVQMEGQLARDRALLDNARRDLERYRSLIAQDAVAHQQVDTQASLIAQLEGTVKTDEGQLASARLQRQYCRVTAPIGGRVGLRLVDPGNIVHAADTNGLLVITQVQPIAVLFAIAEDALPSILQRLRASATLPVEALNRDGTRHLATGRLATTDNQIDATTGTVRLKALFDNTDAALFPNQFVNVKLTVDVERQQVIAPPAAIRRGTQGSFVYLVQRQGASTVVRVRPVTVGVSQPDAVSVTNGLHDGDELVVDGMDDLRDGSRIQIATPPAAAPAGTTPAATASPGSPPAGSASAGSARAASAPAGGVPTAGGAPASDASAKTAKGARP